MTTRACLILVAALLALPASASAQADAPPMPTVPGPKIACKPSKGQVCGPDKPLEMKSALARYTKNLRSDKVRRGLGIPSLRRLFGKAGARAGALADGRLTRAPRGTRATSAAALRPVGSVGAVRVQATAAPGLGAGVDQIGYTDRIYGPRGSQTRSIRFTATADACPVAAQGNDNVGKDVGKLLAAEHIVTVERSGHFELTTDFTLDTIGSRETWGLVNGNAELTFIEPNPKPTAYARIRRVRRMRDLRTGRTYREKPLELRYELKMISPLAMDGEFDRFISKYGEDNDDDPADAVLSDRLLNTAAFEGAARTFMTAVESKTRTIFERAEQEWRTPNRCVQVQSDMPERLIPGQSVKVHVSASSKRGDPAQSLRAYAHYWPYRSAGLAVDPDAVVEPDANVAHDFTVTPPAQAWPDDSPERLRILFYSTGGIGELDSDLKAQTLPIRYRVLDATYSLHASGSKPGGKCASFGGTSGSLTLTGTSDGVVQDINDGNTTGGNVLGGQSLSGPLFGGIYAKARTTISSEIHGCEYDQSHHLQSCSRTTPPTALPNPFTIGFNMQVQNPSSGVAAAHWQVLAPGLGDAGTLVCDVWMHRQIAYDETAQTIPLSKLLSTEPQTFTFSKSMHFDQDQLGNPASIDYDWTYSITVQRI